LATPLRVLKSDSGVKQ